VLGLDSRRSGCPSAEQLAWRCSGMFTTPAACPIKNEESNPFRAATSGPDPLAVVPSDEARLALESTRALACFPGAIAGEGGNRQSLNGHPSRICPPVLREGAEHGTRGARTPKPWQ